MFILKANKVLQSRLLIYIRAKLLLIINFVVDIIPKGSNLRVTKDFTLLYFIGGLCFQRFNREDIIYKVSVLNYFQPEVFKK